MKTKEEALEMLLTDTYHITLNMNDTFAYACADSEEVDADDMMSLLPLIQEFEYDAITAFVSVKREIMEGYVGHPISYKDNSKYREARDLIVKSLNDPTDERFCSLRYDKSVTDKQVAEFGEKIRWAKGTEIPLPDGKYKSILMTCYLQKAQIFGSGFNMSEAEKDLRKKFQDKK
jgi:hypothetical protein